jgi:hypothetical protein
VRQVNACDREFWFHCEKEKLRPRSPKATSHAQTRNLFLALSALGSGSDDWSLENVTEHGMESEEAP